MESKIEANLMEKASEAEGAMMPAPQAAGRMGAADESLAAVDIERCAREMGLAIPAGASGLAHWLPAGMRLREAVMSMSLAMHEELGYMQVKSPSLAPRSLFELSGHAEKYGELMFWASEASGGAPDLALRPMSCPNHLAIWSSKRRSVAELPWQVFEFGEVFRNEPSGSLAFLLRQRQFCQDDSHVAARLPQVGALAKGWLSMARRACQWMGCGEPELRLASRPASRMGSDSSWDLAEGMLASELGESGSPWSWAPGEGAFYGPKIELGVRDRLGRSWQLGVFQLDMQLPGRFGMAADGLDPGEPIALVHHAVFGSVERAIGVMLACKGKAMPPWAHPNALAVVPVSRKHMQAAEAFEKKAAQIVGRRAWLCRDDLPLSAKIAKAKESGFLRVAVVGGKEEQAALSAGPSASMDGAMVGVEEACEGLLWVQ